MDASCDTVANAQGPAYLKVVNRLDTGLEWRVDAYAFGGLMQPDTCNIFGVQSGEYMVDLDQCTFSSDSECNFFGTTKSLYFSVEDGETYTINVDKSFF